MHSPTPSFTGEQILFLLQRADNFNFPEQPRSYITLFLRSGSVFKMAIYQPFAMPYIMSQPGFWSDSIRFRVLKLTGSLSGNGKVSCWRDSAMQGFSNARDAFQEAFCYLRPISLESGVTDALEEYVCNCISQTPILFDSLSEGGGCFREKET